VPDPIKRLPDVPAERTLRVIGGRGKLAVLHHLLGGPKRFSELERVAPGLSRKVLAHQLRAMQEHGIVQRIAAEGVAPRKGYSLTQLGQSLGPVVTTLSEWGRQLARQRGR